LSPPVAFILKGYPRLSETFIAQEIAALERRGLAIEIVSLRHPTDASVHPVHREIKARITYLPEYLHREPLRVLAAWARARRLPGYARAWRIWRADLARDRSANRIRRFGQACVLATEVAPRVGWLHAHFLHTPASVARYAAIMAGLPWSGSAHAKDIYTSPDWELSEKLADCRWLVTCTAANRDHLARLAPPGRVGLVYHGLDLSRWPAGPVRPPRNGSLPAKEGAPADPVMLIAVGRAVEKKGLDDLIGALALLPAGLSWHLTHIGGGPLKEALQRQAAEAGLAARLTWMGARPQEEVLAAYRQADLFCLAPRIAGDGDRDGLPNVLMEAQSQGLAVVATRVSAVPELIVDGANGLLVEPGDRAGLAAALERLIRDPELRARLGAAGEARVRDEFAMEAGIDDLAARFGLEDGA
jgi:glycosyltransferase involved in cell wall biosynthesis